MQDDKFENEDGSSEPPEERHFSAADRAVQTSNELRTHAELAAVFEAMRKFDAQVRPRFSGDAAREIQRTMARLDKSRDGNSPIVAEPFAAEAAGLLTMPVTESFQTGDYHVHRRPGEAMIVRWLAGDEVETFYERLQAHFDAGMESVRERERSQSWKGDEASDAYLKLLEELNVSMAERHGRELSSKLGLYFLSTQTADEINVRFLCEHLMGAEIANVLGEAADPGEGASDNELAWFFKLFLLRGAPEGTERACFFTFLQKTDDSGW